MQFLVYLTVLMVSISTVLLELQWLTSPPPQPKPAVQATSAPPPPKAEGPSAALSPVYPRKIETAQTAANAPQVPAGQAGQSQPQQPQAPTGQSQPQALPVQSQAQQPQAKPQPETTGMATRTEDPTPPPAAPTRASVQQASAAPPEASASNNRCDVQTCASAYRSFRASDCTYQPFDGGERRLCAKGPATARSAARDLNSEPTTARRSNRDVEFHDRNSERRTRGLRTDDEDDDAADANDGERDEPWLFLFGSQRRRW